MPTDTSQHARITQLKGQILSDYHDRNPGKQICGPKGTSESVLTGMKIYQGGGTVAIRIQDIATLSNSLSGTFWDLNKDTIIYASQTLTVPAGLSLRMYSTTLTNNGTIYVDGFIRCTADNNIISGQLYNNGNVHIRPSGDIAIVDNGILQNTGLIRNYGLLTVQTWAVITNNSGGVINNNGTIQINADYVNATYINNAGGTITNLGLFLNNNNGKIYNNHGGHFDNRYGTYNSIADSSHIDGTFYNGIVGVCGTGSTSGSVTITGNMCPP